MAGSIALLFLVLALAGSALGIEDLDLELDRDITFAQQEPTSDIPASLFPRQKVDHFSHQDKRVWGQRYYIDDRFYRPGGPVFIEISGEWTLRPPGDPFWGLSSLTRRFGAIRFNVEHRFYGVSLPFGTDMSLQALQYLSSQQALEDIAYFIQEVVRKEHGFNLGPIVTLGCSYAGALAVWFR